ncbi:L-amino acid N-acyltransferase YncA [Arcticibacter pallidicorallinus]|uniref:L-amino acid N-acyltransferase YncA n=1 Tax=Arcticibacter pallidicorallinus TaxID=1259464 RepID=A0A2T0U5A6_9SPHI|nr:GNAT family N-acetyltransferase [Arcticibacter pallidicorallinus]PRY53099.1 L-amino acid N-acyltransferase YncA [Arcticibacter pallidicorallinus]
MDIAIRRARRDDCGHLLEMVKGLALYEKAPQEVTVTLEEFTDSGFGTDPVWTAFVAEVDGRLEGFALYYVRFSTWKGCRMYLEDFYVNESLRGNGVGTLLFERILQEAREKKFNGISWQVLDWNEPAINFYKKYNARFEGEWINVSLSSDQLSECLVTPPLHD